MQSAPKVSFENFRPRLKPGRVIPQGSRLIYETQDGEKQIILPIELSDAILLAGGRYTMREIIEKTFKRKGSVHFKTLFRAIHQLRAYGFLENGDELEVYNPFAPFERHSGRGVLFDILLLSRKRFAIKLPALFYVFSMSILVLGIYLLTKLPWPILSSAAFIVNESRAIGIVWGVISLSLVLSVQASLKAIYQIILTGNVFGVAFRITPWGLYLRTIDEPVFLITNRLFVILYHATVVVCPLLVWAAVDSLMPQAAWLPTLLAVVVFKLVYDLSPMSESEMIRCTRSLMSLSESDILAGFMSSSSIMNLLSPEHELRSKNLRLSFLLYIWTWNLVVIGVSMIWLRVLNANLRTDPLGSGMVWMASLWALFFILSRFWVHVRTTLLLPVLRWIGRSRVVSLSPRRPAWSKERVIETVEELPLFSYFSPALLTRVLSKSEVLYPRSGSRLITQGEIGKHLFVLLDGALVIEHYTAEQGRQRISRLLPVSIFGEMAIIEESVRTADVIVTESSVVLKIPADVLRLAAGESQYMREIEAFKNAIIVNQFFASAPMFRELNQDLIQGIISRSTLKFFERGSVIFRQGDPGTSFFMVVRGAVEVWVDKRPVKRIRQGGFFGEIAVIADVPRTGTVIASESMAVLEIAASSFWEILSQNIELAMFIETVGETRLREDLLKSESAKLLKPTGTG